MRACPADGCDRAVTVRGLCARHYRWARRHGTIGKIRHCPVDVRTRGPVFSPACQICGRPISDHGVTEFCELVARRGAM